MKILVFACTAVMVMAFAGVDLLDVVEPLGKGLPYKHG